MSLLLYQRKKCAGCKALELLGDKYQCKLGVEIKFEMFRNKPRAPRPKDECYNPKNHRELRKAKELMAE